MDATNHLDSQNANQCDFTLRKARQFSALLSALNEAREYAEDLSCSNWDFAIKLSDAFVMNVCENDVRWMLRKGWIECRPSTGSGGNMRTINAVTLTASDSIVLGIDGLRALQRLTSEPASQIEHEACEPIVHHHKPCWNAERHELTYEGAVVKRYRWPAINQERILQVFEEESWPARIDDPLPVDANIEPKRRLSDSIKCLNRNQAARLIRFRGDGTGEGILWDAATG